MNTINIIIICLLVVAAPLVLYALYRSPAAPDPMRTADQRQIERETAKLQRQVPDPRPAREPVRNITSLCKERARKDARHQARMQELYGIEPVNRYPEGDPCRVWWAIALAEMHTEIAHAKSPINQFNH